MPSGIGEGDEKEQSQGQEGNRENAGKKKGSRRRSGRQSQMLLSQPSMG